MPNKRPRILIIDDDDGFCRLVQKHLERSQFDVARANSATEGLSYIERERFEAVILDHFLPEYEGLELLAKLQAGHDPPPVVYLTANAESRVAVSALKAGAYDYVMKDMQGDFFVQLENAVTNAMFARAISYDKDRAEAEVRTARDQFKALAEERALLLREVNHRVSNSLQLIASLLHFQGDASEDASVKAALKEAIGRVMAVARVHRSLYTSSNVRFVAMADYLKSLIDDLKDVSARSPEMANNITLNAEALRLGPDTAVSAGIVMTELVLNALKHAYPGGAGPVRVALRARDGEIILSVEDDGVGAAGEKRVASRRGLGQRIIAGMADKLDGTFGYQASERGTKAILTFPLQEITGAETE